MVGKETRLSGFWPKAVKLQLHAACEGYLL